jgi:hypothetical protein
MNRQNGKCHWLSITLITASDQKYSFDTERVSSGGSLRESVLYNKVQVNEGQTCI